MEHQDGNKGDSHVQMEAVEDADENELLGHGDDEQEDRGETDGVDETAEDLMTDMKLTDEIDDARNMEPDFEWTYFIEVYPWSADDLTDSFMKLIRLAQFSRLVLKKKKISNESLNTERSDDKLPVRQRKGCLQFYLEDRQTAKVVIRNLTWKSMSAKELTVEITKRDLAEGSIESAYLELNTYPLCKCRFREKPKGELKDRSAKVSNLPGAITRGFLEVVLNRAYPVIGGETQKIYDTNPLLKLQDVEGFDGSLDFDCLTRGSCRAFVQAHRKVVLNGEQLEFAANDDQTMVVPPFTHDLGKKKPEPEIMKKSGGPQKSLPFQSNRGGRGGAGVLPLPIRGAPGGFPGPRMPRMRGVNRGMPNRGMGRAIMPLMRPVSAPLPRPSPGMPVPMTGRQKMNEKLRRNNLGNSVAGVGGLLPPPGGSMGVRGSVPGSVGDSFKQEIASLQSQLQRSTEALEARIAMLQQSGGDYSLYNSDMGGFDSGAWDRGQFDYSNDYVGDDYTQDDMYGMMTSQSFAQEPPALMQTSPSPGRGLHRGRRPMQRGASPRGMPGMRGNNSRGRNSRRGNVPVAWN